MTLKPIALMTALALLSCTHFDDPTRVDVGVLKAPDDTGTPDPTGSIDPPELLINRGIMARYMINEDSSGSSVTAVKDFGGAPVDLNPIYDSANDQFVEKNGHRGIQFAGPNTNHGLFASSDGNKFETQIQDATDLTFEVVIDIQSAVDQSRLMYLGQKNNYGLLTISTTDTPGHIRMGWRNGERLAEWPVNYESLGRVVLTFVIDLDSPDNDQRVRLYKDGEAVVPTGIATIADDQILDFLGEVDTQLVLSNKGDQSAGLDAIYYYAAFYNTALTDNEISSNAERLLLDDDTP